MLVTLLCWLRIEVPTPKADPKAGNLTWGGSAPLLPFSQMLTGRSGMCESPAPPPLCWEHQASAVLLTAPFRVFSSILCCKASTVLAISSLTNTQPALPTQQRRDSLQPLQITLPVLCNQDLARLAAAHTTQNSPAGALPFQKGLGALVGQGHPQQRGGGSPHCHFPKPSAWAQTQVNGGPCRTQLFLLQLLPWSAEQNKEGP